MYFAFRDMSNGGIIGVSLEITAIETFKLCYIQVEKLHAEPILSWIGVVELKSVVLQS